MTDTHGRNDIQHVLLLGLKGLEKYHHILAGTSTPQFVKHIHIHVCTGRRPYIHNIYIYIHNKNQVVTVSVMLFITYVVGVHYVHVQVMVKFYPKQIDNAGTTACS